MIYLTPDLVDVVRVGWVPIVIGFLIGAIPFGLLVSRAFFKRDIRSEGSGNIGAANALRTMGTKAGLAVLLLDAAKGVAAVLIATPFVPLVRFFAKGTHPFPHTIDVVPLIFNPGAQPLTRSIIDNAVRHEPYHIQLVGAVASLAALAAIVGHCYSPYLRLRGGKGVATYLGATFALSWEAGLAFCAIWFAAAKPTGYASLGSILGTCAAAVVFWSLHGEDYGIAGTVYALGSIALIVFKHRENIGRLRAGTESSLAILKR